MPSVQRRRRIAATPERLWEVVANPQRLGEWWPNVQRVEDASHRAWTLVLTSPKGKSVRADYTLIASERPLRRSWRHEVEESPFERILAESSTELELNPADAGEADVALTTHLRLRGLSRLGGFQVSRATSRQLDGALDGLEALAGEWRAR